MKYDETKGQWSASYPWIKDPCSLTYNKQAVLGTLRSCERKLLKNKELADLYSAQIQDMMNRNVCRKIEKTEIDNYQGPLYFLPHHHVLKLESQSTPCRIVFNSSAKCNGQSLNDLLVKGPDMLNNLPGVLLRFREEQYA